MARLFSFFDSLVPRIYEFLKVRTGVQILIASAGYIGGMLGGEREERYTMFCGCYTAEWQSRSALREMLDDTAKYPHGPAQEAAGREVVVATRDEALACLQANRHDIVYRTATIVGPWYYYDYGDEEQNAHWTYDNIESDIELDNMTED